MIQSLEYDEIFCSPLSYALFHDVLNDVTYPEQREYSSNQLRMLFSTLPLHLQYEAYQHGFDTVMCSQLHKHFSSTGISI